MIRATEQDVATPRNLHDWELTEDMTELPPSRPLSEVTSVSYLLIKGQILEIMGRIVDFMSSLQVWDYESVLTLDHDLEKVIKSLPDYWKMQKDGDTEEESPSLLNRRIQVMFLYHQGMCVLHRKFLAQGRSDKRFSRSRSRCIESAMALLAQQYYLYVETKIKQTMASKHWYRASYTSQEYVLAAMIVVLELRHRKLEVFDGNLETRAKEETEMLEALQNVCLIWKTVEKFPEGDKVYVVLSNMFSQLIDTDSFGNGAIAQSPELAQMPEFAARQTPGYVAPDPALAGDMEIDWYVVPMIGACDRYILTAHKVCLGFIHRRDQIRRCIRHYLVPISYSSQPKQCDRESLQAATCSVIAGFTTPRSTPTTRSSGYSTCKPSKAGWLRRYIA